jgi:autotransporter-associated beta strand protein
MNFTAPGAQYVQITRFGTAPIVGPGTTNFGTNVRTALERSNYIDDSATVVLTGSSGGATSVKFDLGGNTETIGSLTIDSPTGATASAPTLRGSSALTVTGTTTFQGTADAVNIDTTGATNNLLTTDSMTFGGTGTWAVSGDGRIRLNAASGTRTITTTADASISNTLTGTQGFTKEGAGTLTLNGTNIYTGTATVNAGTLSLGNGTSSSALSDFGGLAVVSPAVVNLNYTGSDAVLSLDLGGSPAAAGTWGATGSGAANINDTYFTGTGVINNLNGNTGLIGVLFWDGGTEDILTGGDVISAGGTGTWDTAILNWDSGTIAHAAWLNTTSATAIFGGTAGTVTLGTDITLKGMTLETVGYTFGGSDLDFAAGGTIEVTTDASGTMLFNNGITGNPALRMPGANAGNIVRFNPTSASQTLGVITNPYYDGAGDKAQLTLDGTTTDNTIDGITYQKSPAGLHYGYTTKQGTGTWTVNGDVEQGKVNPNGGTLIINGTFTSLYQGFGPIVSGARVGGALNYYQSDSRFGFFTVNSGGIVAPGNPTVDNGVGTIVVEFGTGQATVGQTIFNDGSIYEWQVGPANVTDKVHVKRTSTVTNNNRKLTVGAMVLKILDAGGTPLATDQLPVFTYDASVDVTAVNLSAVTFDTSALDGSWTIGTLALTDDGAGTIYLTGLSKSGGGDPFVTWAAAAGLDGTPGKENGKADDPDGDGKNNLYEFAFNGDPLDGSDNGLIAGLVQDASAPAGNELTLVVAVRDGATFTGSGTPVVQSNTTQVDGLTYTIQGTLDLATIPGSDVSHVGGPSDTAPAATGLPNLTGTDWEYHTFKLDASEGLGSKGFLRAKVADTP